MVFVLHLPAAAVAVLVPEHPAAGTALYHPYPETAHSPGRRHCGAAGQGHRRGGDPLLFGLWPKWNLGCGSGQSCGGQCHRIYNESSKSESFWSHPDKDVITSF